MPTATLREPCPIHPSIPKDFCSCRGRGGRTSAGPVFTIRESTFEGYPVIELLKSGGPIHRYDQHFRFGVARAEMLLACLDPIYEFAWASDEERRTFKPRIVQEGPRSIRVSVEFYEDFTWSTGELIEEPWLRLESLDGRHLVKGLGVMKCRAVWILREEIGEWVARQRYYRYY